MSYLLVQFDVSLLRVFAYTVMSMNSTNIVEYIILIAELHTQFHVALWWPQSVGPHTNAPKRELKESRFVSQ